MQILNNRLAFLFLSLSTFFIALSSNYERDLKNAVEANRSFTVQSIFEALDKAKIKINLNSQDKDGDTLLHSAVGWSNKNMINLLLQNGANPNVQNKLGETPFFNENEPEMVALFVKYKANADIANKAGINALQRAVRLNLVDVVRLFLQAGANVNVTDSNGDTLLMKAAVAGNNELVQLLLDFDVDAFLKNKNGEIVLYKINSYYTRTILMMHPYYKLSFDSHFKTLYSGFPGDILNGVTKKEIEKANNECERLNKELEFLKRNSKLKMENGRGWLQQNLYDYFLVNETINKIDHPYLKPRKFCYLDRIELLYLRNDLRNSIEKIKSSMNKSSYAACFNKALKDVCISLELGAGSIGVDII